MSEIPASTRKRIERAYTRAMNIRDSTPGYSGDISENRYSRAYRRAYRDGDLTAFRKETRRYLKAVREGATNG